MPNEVIEGVGTALPDAAADYSAVIDQLKSANVQLMNKIKDLEARSAANEQKIAAFLVQNTSPQEETRTDAAFEKALAELGIKLEKCR